MVTGRIRRPALLIVILLLASLTSYAQTSLGIVASLSGTVKGVVLDKDGNPLPRATVTLDNKSIEVVGLHGVTNAQGEFRITLVPAGKKYSLKASLEGYQEIVLTIDVYTGKTTVANVTLREVLHLAAFTLNGLIKWGDPPPAFEKVVSFAVMSGEPNQSGLFVVRLKLPPGYGIAPHWHPTDVHVTVLSGTVAFGIGETFDIATMKDLPSGGYALLPAEMRHYVRAKTEATIQVHGMGPFVLTYVNPADDPRNQPKAIPLPY